MCSPLAATQFAQIPRWSFHYLVSLGLSLSNVAFLILVFRLKDQTGKIFLPNAILMPTITAACLAEIGQVSEESLSSEKRPLLQILRLKSVHILAAFLLVYVGVEVTIGGQSSLCRFRSPKTR